MTKAHRKVINSISPAPTTQLRIFLLQTHNRWQDHLAGRLSERVARAAERTGGTR
jgi:hypothetical protein